MQGHRESGGRARSARPLSPRMFSRWQGHELTDVPPVIGICMSNTIIFAVNVEVKGTIFPGRQRTVPMFNDMGSTPVRVRFTFEPALAHGRLSPSLSMTKWGSQSTNPENRRLDPVIETRTLDSCRLISWDDSQTFPGNDDAAADPTRDAHTRGRAFENVGYGEPQRRVYIACGSIQNI